MLKKANEVRFVFANLLAMQMGINLPVTIDFDCTPHAVIFGSTGTGKTYCLKHVLNQIYNQIYGVRIWLLDFKGQDFRYLSKLNPECPRYFPFEQCSRGFNEFYSEFINRQAGKADCKYPIFMVFDEFASYLNFVDKKEAEDAKRRLSTLLMLGRSFNAHVIISQQRADAEYFAKARDNFGLVIAMGNISKESAAMFNFDRDSMIEIKKIGGGHLLKNSTSMTPIYVPKTKDVELMKTNIARLTSRS